MAVAFHPIGKPMGFHATQNDDLSILKSYESEQLGKVQAVLCTLSELPEGFVFPSVDEMTEGGSEVCEHPYDIEHE